MIDHVASALMAKMQIAERDRPRVKFECLRLLATLKLDRARMQLISGFVDSYLRLTAAEETSFHRQIQAADLEEREEVMEIVTSWMEEGLQKGRQEGRHEGAESLVEQLVQRRFGQVPANVRGRLRSLSERQLTDLAEALSTFPTASDLTSWLDQRLNA